MSNRGKVGNILKTGRGDGEISSFEWRIPDFSSLAGKRGDWYESPDFDACDRRWFFEICPKGMSRHLTSQWMSLVLVRLDSGPPQTLDITLGIWGPDGVENKRGRVQEFSDDDYECFWSAFCSRSKLREHNFRLMPRNVLIFSLDMKGVVASVGRGCEKVHEDFGRLLATGKQSDFTVQVGDEEFKVHRSILFARCPALSVSLRHESRENMSNRIVIEDCDADVFREYLRYLYTGSAQSLTQQNVFGLYRVADMYLADDLKLQCLNYVRDTLCVQTFCDAIKLALTHGKSGLLELATNFATANFPSIVCSAEWQNFNHEYPLQVNEILIKCFGPRS